MILRAFVRKKPMVRMMSSTCSGFAAASSAGPGYSPNSSGVTMFTRLSVVCALNTVATSSSKGELKFNAHFGSGISTHNCSYS